MIRILATCSLSIDSRPAFPSFLPPSTSTPSPPPFEIFLFSWAASAILADCCHRSYRSFCRFLFPSWPEVRSPTPIPMSLVAGGARGGSHRVEGSKEESLLLSKRWVRGSKTGQSVPVLPPACPTNKTISLFLVAKTKKVKRFFLVSKNRLFRFRFRQSSEPGVCSINTCSVSSDLRTFRNWCNRSKSLLWRFSRKTGWRWLGSNHS